MPATVTLVDRRRLFGPAVFALVAVGVLGVAGLFSISPVAVVLACATLVVLVARTLLAFRDNTRLLEDARREALTDALTALGNRRRLARDFESGALRQQPDFHQTLVLFDLDGFKAYNDAFGHPAGDALLARLGGRLEQAVAPHVAYRVGGENSACSWPPTGSGRRRSSRQGERLWLRAGRPSQSRPPTAR